MVEYLRYLAFLFCYPTAMSLLKHQFSFEHSSKAAASSVTNFRIYYICRKKTEKNSVIENIGEVFTMMALNVVWQIGTGSRLRDFQ